MSDVESDASIRASPAVRPAPLGSGGALAALAHPLGWSIPAFLALYFAATFWLGTLELRHALLLSMVVALAAFAPTRRALTEGFPFLAFVAGYDLVRHPREALVTAERVAACSMQELERTLVPAPGGSTWPDVLQAHQAAGLDLLAAAPYLVFVYVVAGHAVFLFFRDRERMRHFLWTFAIGNYLAFVAWLALPVAPPWYVRAHGCLVDAAALPSAAGLSRVDELFGIGYFGGLYSQASSVFGAMPSMHCAYPAMGLLVALRYRGLRALPLHAAYALWMAWAAVYLDHHWVLDVLGGWVVALLAFWCAEWCLARPGFRRLAMLEAAPREGARRAARAAP